jgi:LytS/YehU family sensor histidine kinase
MVFFIILIVSLFFMGSIAILKFKEKDPSFLFIGFVFFLNIILLIVDINNEIFEETNNSLYNQWIIFFFIVIQSLLFEKEYTSYSKKLLEFESQVKSIQDELKGLKLESIRKKMNPNYLFTSLKFIKSMIHSNSQNTDKAILYLAGNYRFLLENAGEKSVNFEDEWQFLKEFCYLIELQYESKLNITLDKVDNFSQFSIIPLTLHPLIGYLIDFYVKIPEINNIQIECKAIKRKKLIFIEINSQIYHENGLDTFEYFTSFSSTLDRIKGNLSKIDPNSEIATNDYKNNKRISLRFTIPPSYNSY